MKPTSSKHKTDKRTFFVRVICIVLCVLMLGGLLTSALLTIASAKSSAEYKKEIAALKEEASKISKEGDALQAEMDANKGKQQTTIEQKTLIDKRIQITESEIRNANAQIQQYGLLIAEKQSELEAALAEQEELTQRYKTRLRAMEETGNISYWSVLFKAKSFSDLLSRIDSIHEVAEADNRMLREIQEKADAIDQSRRELEEELAAQQNAKVVLEQLEQELLTQRAEADSLMLELEEAYLNLSDEFLANEDEEAAVRAQIMEAQKAYEKALKAEEAARLAEANKNNVAGGKNPTTGSPSASGFISPLPKGSTWVSCAYGWRNHPLWGDRRFHHGVDLAANQGTPIYAIAAGTVTIASYTDANGYYVSLSHGNGFGSIYCHMTHYTVKPGQSVKQGQIIGYVGSTGWSTGPHLHFEIHKNGSSVNPMSYITLN